MTNNAVNKSVDGAQHVLLRRVFAGGSAEGLKRETLEAALELSRRAVLNTGTPPSQIVVHQHRISILVQALQNML